MVPILFKIVGISIHLLSEIAIFVISGADVSSFPDSADRNYSLSVNAALFKRPKAEKKSSRKGERACIQKMDILTCQTHG